MGIIGHEHAPDGAVSGDGRPLRGNCHFELFCPVVGDDGGNGVVVESS